MVPDAKIASASFEEPWLDIGIFPGTGAQDEENPWGLPWWPRTRLEMYMSGFVSTSLVLVMAACAWCSVCQRLEKRRAAAHVPLSPSIISPAADRASPLPTGLHFGPGGPRRVGGAVPPPAPRPVASATSESHRVIGRSVDGFQETTGGPPRGTTSRGARWVPSIRHQNEAVATLLEMGFAYEPALAALQANNFEVQQAVAVLSQ